MNMLRVLSTGTLAASLLIGATTFAQEPTSAQQPVAGQQPASAPITTASSEAKTASNASWSNEELLTATVHDAWILSGKNEATFFEMVTQLAQLSATKRGLTLPETQEAGRRTGELIKKMAKADTSQLLYVVVDKAVQKVGVPSKS